MIGGNTTLWAKVIASTAASAVAVGAGVAVVVLAQPSSSTVTTPSQPALATHVPDYLPPGNACAAVGYPDLTVSITANGVDGSLGAAPGTPLAGSYEMVFPEGFHFGQRDGQRVVLSGDESVVIHDGDLIHNPAICEFDGKFYLDDPISVPQPAAEASPTPYPVDAAIAWRKEFGLRAVREYVEKINADPSSTMEFGVPLSRQEADELNQRNAVLAKVLESLPQDVTNDPAYGGMYVDQTKGAHIVVLTTGDPKALDSVFAKYADSGATFEALRVEYTYQELLQLQSVIGSQLEKLRGQGINIVQAGVDIKANHLEVGVASLTTKQSATLSAEFGPRIKVVEAEAAQL